MMHRPPPSARFALAAALTAALSASQAVCDDTAPAAPADARAAAARSAPLAVMDLTDDDVRQPQPVASLTLKFSEKAGDNKSPEDNGSRGMVKIIEGVTAAMAGANDAIPTHKAAATFKLEPIIREPSLPDGPWTVTLRATLDSKQFDEALSSTSKLALEQELRVLENQLKSWSHELNREQELRLKLQGAAKLTLDQPLAVLSKWQAEPVVLRLERALEPQVVAVRLYSIGPGDRLHRVEEVVAGIPMVIELWLNRPIERDRIPVHLRAGDRPLTLSATRLDLSERQYLSEPFLPTGSTGLPTSSLPIVPSGSEETP